MKHPTATLEGANLDYAVALALGLKSEPLVNTRSLGEFKWIDRVSVFEDGKGEYWFAPSTDWSQGGPIIEREKIGLVYWRAKLFLEPGWQANIEMPGVTSITSPTALIAAMRCFVASKLGEEVEIP